MKRQYLKMPEQNGPDLEQCLFIYKNTLRTQFHKISSSRPLIAEIKIILICYRSLKQHCICSTLTLLKSVLILKEYRYINYTQMQMLFFS